MARKNTLAWVILAVVLALAQAADARSLRADATFAVPKLHGAMAELAASWLVGSSSAHQHVQAALQQHLARRLQDQVYWQHFEL